MKGILIVITLLSLFAFGGFYLNQKYELNTEPIKNYVCGIKTEEQIYSEKLADMIKNIQLLETIVCYKYSSGYLHCFVKDQGTGQCYKQIITENFSMQSFSKIDCQEVIDRLKEEAEDGTDERLEEKDGI